MLLTVVGQTGSGKTTIMSMYAYDELTRIMSNDKEIKWYDLKTEHSYYDYVALNYDFNDGRGNYTRYVYNINECTCGRYQDFNFQPHWDFGGKCIGITDLPELYDKKNLLVFLDEAGTQFANTDWDKMPERYRLFLTTHRHNVTGFNRRFDIWVMTQHKDLIEVTLRRISNRIFLIRPLFGFTRNPLRPSIVSRLPLFIMKVYWRHEVLESRPIVVNQQEDLNAQDQLEGLEYYTWYYIGKKYRKTFDSIGEVRDLKRESKKIK